MNAFYIMLSWKVVKSYGMSAINVIHDPYCFSLPISLMLPLFLLYLLGLVAHIYLHHSKLRKGKFKVKFSDIRSLSIAMCTGLSQLKRSLEVSVDRGLDEVFY